MSTKRKVVMPPQQEESLGFEELAELGRGTWHAAKRVWNRIRGKEELPDNVIRITLAPALVVETPIKDDEEYSSLWLEDLDVYLDKLVRNPTKASASELCLMLWQTVVKWFMPPPGRMATYAQQQGFLVASDVNTYPQLVMRVLYITGFYGYSLTHGTKKATCVVSRAIGHVLSRVKKTVLQTLFGLGKKDDPAIAMNEGVANHARRLLYTFGKSPNEPLIAIGREGELVLDVVSEVVVVGQPETFVPSHPLKLPVVVAGYRSDGFLVLKGKTPEADEILQQHDLRDGIDPSRVSPGDFGYDTEEADGEELVELQKRLAAFEMGSAVKSIKR